MGQSYCGKGKKQIEKEKPSEQLVIYNVKEPNKLIEDFKKESNEK